MPTRPLPDSSRTEFVDASLSVASETRSAPSATGAGSLLRHTLVFGLVGAALIALLKTIEYRYLIIEYSVEAYGGLVAVVFVALGLWLGRKLTTPPAPVVIREFVPAPAVAAAADLSTPAPPAAPLERAHAGHAVFTPDTARVATLGITPRELEVLTLIAAGLSTREIAERVYVSENTVKTHSRRLFEKLGARRRTQAVQLAKESGLLP